MKLNQKGFSAFEIILVVVALVATGAAGYYAFQARHTTDTDNAVTLSKNAHKTVPAPQAASNLTTYTYGDFTLQYPSAWIVDVSEGGASMLSIVGKPVNFWPTKDKSGTANVTVLEFEAGSDYLQKFKDSAGYVVVPTETPITINGNPGYVIKEQNPSYTDVNYIISHDKHAVSIGFRLNSSVAGSNPAIDNSMYQSAFDAIAHSVKFMR